MPVFISLLRGINVGGNKRIKMADLCDLYDTLGFSNIKTILQSGNAVFTTDDTDMGAIRQRIEDGIQAKFGFESKVIMRTPSDFQAIVDNPPLSRAQLVETSRILVMFLREPVEASAVEAMIEAYEGNEHARGGGYHIFLYYPTGIGRSKLTHNWIEKQLNTVGTARNWNTVNKLRELADSMTV